MSIISSRVPDDLRCNFLPQHFGFSLMSKIENAIYSGMRALCKHYNGGYWHFYELSNEGVYLAPTCEDEFFISVAGNDFSGRVSADAAGIIVTLFALNYLCNRVPNFILCDKYHLLLDFAIEHEESRNIYAAIY